MPKFKLIAEHLDEYGNTDSTVTHEFNKEYLPEVIQSIQEFLRGVGFYFDGDLVIEADEPPTQGYTPNEYFWDTDRNR